MNSSVPAKPTDLQQLDALTGGAFSAATSGERAARVREWLASEPEPEQLQVVFKELSVKDKGAAKLLRERLDDIRRAKGQEAMAAEWAGKAQALLESGKLNIADALAWQRDAAKAGAPLSREPLAGLKVQLAERVKVIEDLQHRVQVQREAAVLLAQRIEVLSTKSWKDAQAAADALRADVTSWQEQAAALPGDANWSSVDARFPPQLETSRGQLTLVWEAFSAALAQAVAAAADPAQALPQVPVWADELRQARGLPPETAPQPAKPKVDPQIRAQATSAVREALSKLEQEVAEGHGKASTGAAANLRQALKEHGRHIDDALDKQVHAALAAAGELEGWQRWRADQLREELVGKAEALLNRPEGQTLGGRKMQETLRALRDQWKQTDQGGVPNHALWKRFDEACNQAHKVVEAWLDKVRAEAAEHRSKRLALVEELKAWAAANTTAAGNDWKGFSRELHQFAERWREAGHLSEKAFAELQPLWKAAMAAASAPLEAVQKASQQRRQAMIEEAAVLGAAPVLRIDAVKALQQRWQAEAHAVPMERRHEQKLWDAFRKPIDEAFNRKTAEREKVSSAMSERDRQVMEAAKALEAANAGGDAQTIRAAMNALENALRASESAPVAEEKQALAPVESASNAAETGAEEAPAEAVAPAAEPPKPRKPVVAVRGDDRPGMKKAEPAAPAGRGRPGERREGGRRDERGFDRGAERGGRREPRESYREQPRLGDAAFRAQREALEHAQLALKKLAAQAHGESLTHLLAAWEQRDASQLPTVQELGSRVTPAVRTLWSQALSAAPAGEAATALLRLEIAAEVPTPAAALEARRALQLQLLTKRNDPAPVQTWGQDAARVLGSAFEAEQARRLQNALKVLLRR
ncbi:MAG: DUF349 domain-containing protein [Pseudomonadota bacterium]|nr:DUF349 domain-containing protein [Pseudomonadota bacterium]